MANVLGELFSEIAESIRGGLGDIGTMKPNAFPDKIDEIVELLKNAGTGDGGGGSGGSGSSTSTLKIKSGSYKVDADGSRAEVAHGLGMMPDLVIVYIAGAYELDALQNNSGRYLLYAWGIKDSFDTSSYGGYAIPGLHFANASAINESNSIGVYCPNDEVFQFGDANTTANGRLMPNMNYYWMAFSGLGKAPEPVLQDKTITENGTYSADEGFDGLGEVTVEVTGAGGNEEPLIKFVSNGTTTTGNPTSSHTISFNLSKETKILGAWAGGEQDKSAYPATVSLFPVPVSKVTVDTSNANYNKWNVPFEFYNPFLSGTYKKTIRARILVTVPGITTTSRGDGYYDGKLNYVDTYDYPVRSSSDGVYTAIFFKKFTFADGVSEVPNYLCYAQTYLEDVDLSSITSIGSCAFDSCTSLKSINLSPDLSSIGSYAFDGCTSLTGELVIPQKLTTLANHCFNETKFDRVVFHNNMVFDTYAVHPFIYCTHPTEYDFSAFTHVPALYDSNYFGSRGKGQVFKIPAALFDIWSTSEEWSDWASQMVAV